MLDLTPQLLPQLKTHRLAGLDLGEGFLYPHYSGRSILNLPASLCQLLGAPSISSHPPLAPDILGPFGEDVQRVILVLMDALPFYNFQRWLSDGTAPAWSRLSEGGRLAPLTSIVPSTTSAALTTLWSGLSAAEHGVAGYELWLKEYGMVTNMILHMPMSFQKNGYIGSLTDAGFQPGNYLKTPTLGTHLQAHGVRSMAFQHYGIINSGLSQMFFKDVETHPIGTSTELWINLRTALEKRPGGRQLIWVYWGQVDHYSHVYGPGDERPAAEFAGFGSLMQDLFVSRLNPKLREGTLLLLTADHGQIHTRVDPHYDLRNHPALIRRLHIYPTGENRLTYFHIRPGQTEAVREYLERTWPNQFAIVDPGFAVSAGLLGPGEPHPFLSDRLGDSMIIGRGDAYLWWANKNNPLLGRHGGLSPEEMLVPLLAMRLDA